MNDLIEHLANLLESDEGRFHLAFYTSSGDMDVYDKVEEKHYFVKIEMEENK